MIEFDYILKPFSDLVNRLYDNSFEEFPNFPQFSIWRLMSKTWIKTISEPLMDKLIRAFIFESVKFRVSINHGLTPIIEQLVSSDN